MTGTKKEFEIIRRAFKGNEYLLKRMQALLVGLEISDDDKKAIKDIFASHELLQVVTQRFLPQCSIDDKPGQMNDVWQGVEVTIFGHGEIGIQQATLGNQGAIEMMRTGIALLKNPDGEKVDVSYDPKRAVNDPYAIRLFTRNKYLKNVATVCATLWVIAEMNDEENPQEVAKRLQQDSTK